MGKITDILKKLAGNLDNLEARWRDEMEFEDFEDYKKAMLEAVKKEGCILTGMTSEPFVAVIYFPENKETYKLWCRGDKIVTTKVK